MKILKKKTIKYLVLVPHRDARINLRKYSDELIKAGLTGVYEFPLAAPIAEISSVLNDDELKSISRTLRDTTKEEKFCASVLGYVDLSTGLKLTDDLQKDISMGRLFGHQLEIDLSPAIFSGFENKIKKIFSPLIIGEFFALDKTYAPATKFPANFDIKKTPIPKICFRAASVAIMTWKPFQIAEINGKSDKKSKKTAYKWKIGKLCWLPKR